MSDQANIALSEAAVPPRQLGRSILAILAGFVVVVILSIATDILLHKLGIYPPLGQRISDGLAALATSYRTIYAILGSYITARLAPDRPMARMRWWEPPSEWLSVRWEPWQPGIRT